MIGRLNASFLQTTAAAGAAAVDLFWYAGSLCLLFVKTVGLTFTRGARPRAVLYELSKVGAQSWFIVSLSSLFIGMVLAFQSAYQMQKLSAEIYIAGLVALSLVREIGPVITALIVAGRVGSAIAAELGTMKVTEQIDALVTLATDPVRQLVVPRFIAMVLAVPLLTYRRDCRCTRCWQRRSWRPTPSEASRTPADPSSPRLRTPPPRVPPPRAA